MTVEVATYVGDLVSTNPAAGDPKSEGDDHLRLIKATLQATLPNLVGRFGRTQSKATNYNLVANDNSSVIVVTAGSVTIGSAVAAGTLGNGFFAWILATNGNVTFDPNGAETVNGATTATIYSGAAALVVCTGSAWWLSAVNQAVFLDSLFRLKDESTGYELQFQLSALSANRTATLPDYDVRVANLPAGIIADYGGGSVPTGWLLCDGSSLLRADYAALFAAIGTTWGAVDGTHFNVPDFRGRTTVGDGTGTTVEVSTTSSGNGFVVASNNTRWITGMPVVLSSLSGFTTSASAGPTYYVVRISATNIRLATTLALAQNETPDITVSGSGSVTITHTMTARTLGEAGGEEGHAMSITELLAHTHTGGNVAGTNVPFGGTVTVGNTGSTGGNAAMNIMQPFGVVKKIISY